jgi:hypothetical protein
MIKARLLESAARFGGRILQILEALEVPLAKGLLAALKDLPDMSRPRRKRAAATRAMDGPAHGLGLNGMVMGTKGATGLRGEGRYGGG